MQKKIRLLVNFAAKLVCQTNLYNSEVNKDKTYLAKLDFQSGRTHWISSGVIGNLIVTFPVFSQSMLKSNKVRLFNYKFSCC